MLSLDYANPCIICNENNHNILECPFLNCKITKFSIIANYCKASEQMRSKFKRKNQRKNSLKMLKKLQSLYKTKSNSNEEKINEIKKKTENENDGCFEISSDSSQENSSLEQKVCSIENNLKEMKREDFLENQDEIQMINEKAKKFKFFFPHNNFDLVVKSVNERRKKLNKKFIFSGNSNSQSIVSLITIKEQSSMRRKQIEEKKIRIGSNRKEEKKKGGIKKGQINKFMK